MLPGTTSAVPHHVLVGDDEAFPLLTTYLLRPYPGTQIDDDDEEKRAYNYRLSTARRIVENAFRILSQKFFLLTKGQSINLESENEERHHCHGYLPFT